MDYGWMDLAKWFLMGMCGGLGWLTISLIWGLIVKR